MSLIYRITCTANGKFYIGSTVNKAQRWKRHRTELRRDTHKNRNLQASWNKHGEEAFVFAVVEEVVDATQLVAVEQRWLDQVMGDPLCFNHNKFADAPWRGKSGAETPNYGRSIHTPESRAKLSAAASLSGLGRPATPEMRAKISAANETNPWKGSKHTPEARAKIAEASRGRKHTPEAKAKISAAHKGKEISSMMRLQISRTLQGEGNFWYGKKRDEAFCAAVSRPIIATNPAGLEFSYPSITKLREVLDLKPPTVNRALKSGKPLAAGPRAGWAFRYAAGST